jgi:uncharacterized protein (TIGR00106 family)
MKVSADIAIVPIGVGVSVSKFVAQCEQIFEQHGLNPQLHAYGTNVEGEWDQVFAALRACHEALHGDGAPRLYTTIRLGTRTDRPQSNAEKIASVQKRLDDPAE